MRRAISPHASASMAFSVTSGLDAFFPDVLCSAMLSASERTLSKPRTTTARDTPFTRLPERS
jgi:hypothetical protein